MTENNAFEKKDEGMSTEKSFDQQNHENKNDNNYEGNKYKLKLEEMNENEKKLEKRRILKAVILISAAFLCNFTAYQNLARLQSSINTEEGMGVVNQALLYIFMIISCLFLPQIIITKLGHKLSMIVSLFAYLLWMAANGIPSWWTLTPTSILVGLAAAPLWTAQCAYFSKLASRYSKLTGETQSTVISRFFGIFFVFFQTSNIFGAIISSTILNQRDENTTLPADDYTLSLCGRNDCPHNNVTNFNLKKPESAVRWTMIGVFMGVAFIGVLIIAIFMDRLPKELENEDRSGNLRKDIGKLLVATLKHLKNVPQILLIPLTIYSGVEQAYFTSEYSKSFISCGLGYWMVGFVTLPYGVVNVCVSFSTGRLVKHIGRIPIFVFGMLVDLAIHITLYFWMPHPDSPAVFYIISGMWGITDGIWQTQINALYGSIFFAESEAAFANYRMWEATGFIIVFAYSNYLCTLIKTIVLTSVLVIGMSGYAAVEIYVRKQRVLEISQ